MLVYSNGKLCQFLDFGNVREDFQVLAELNFQPTFRLCSPNIKAMNGKTDYLQFIQSLKSQILQSRYLAARLVNRELLLLYFIVGNRLSEKITAEKWGTKIIQGVSTDLQKELPGLRGFSHRNLLKMKQFAEAYANLSFLPLSTAAISPLSRAKLQVADNQPFVSPEVFFTVGFTQHVRLLSRCSTWEQRLFYMHQTAQNSWTVEMLDFQIDARLFENQGKLANNFSQTLPEKLGQKALLAFKDEYLLDFINVETDDEREVEKGIVANIRQFILTLGKGFAFIGNQFRVIVDGDDYFIDLLFYNRILGCLVAFDLKKGKFKPEYLGKMNFYLNVLNQTERLADENPSIGILLVKEKSETIVEFAFQGLSNPMGVATYKLSEEVPPHLKNVLPDAEALKRLWNDLGEQA